MLMYILGIENGPGLRFHQNSAFRPDLGSFRPPFDLIGLDFLVLALFCLRVIIGFATALIFCG